MKKRLLPFVLAGALTAAFAAPAAAQTNTCNLAIPQRGGAAGLAALVAAAVNAQVGAGVCNVSVDLLNNSINNLLRNADIDVLNNSLNNILQNADIIDDVTVTVTGNVISVDVLSGPDFIINLVP